MSNVAQADGLTVDAQQSISGMAINLSASEVREAQVRANSVIVKAGASARHHPTAVIGSGRSADGKHLIVGPGELRQVELQWAQGNREYATDTLVAITEAFQASRALPSSRLVASTAYWMLARAYSTSGPSGCAQMAHALVRADALGFFVDMPKHEDARDLMYQSAARCLKRGELRAIQSEEVRSLRSDGLAYLTAFHASDEGAQGTSRSEREAESDTPEASHIDERSASVVLRGPDRLALLAGQATGGVVRILHERWKQLLISVLLLIAAAKLWQTIRNAFGDVGAVDLTSSRNRKVREGHARFERY
ncbi:hypothetical protein [Burkholderia cenocepacia]|uniref:hypothetical protein n=1 Tax=Burkholderia cenocepacia TaxID=95486 RepID=UPI0012378415|nr:hypothetical protein [Burkholderia cenocepacia]